MVAAHLDLITIPSLRSVEVSGCGAEANVVVLGVVFLDGGDIEAEMTTTDSSGNFKLQFLIPRRLRPQCNGAQSEYGRVHVGELLAPIPIL